MLIFAAGPWVCAALRSCVFVVGACWHKFRDGGRVGVVGQGAMLMCVAGASGLRIFLGCHVCVFHQGP